MRQQAGLRSKSRIVCYVEKQSKLAISSNSRRNSLAKSRKSFACVVVILALCYAPQSKQPWAQSASHGEARKGSNTGRAATPANTQRKTPITAEGFVDSGSVVFEDVTKAAGLSAWNHTMGAKDKGLICDVNGSGVGLIDYDNDGWLDIY